MSTYPAKLCGLGLVACVQIQRAGGWTSRSVTTGPWGTWPCFTARSTPPRTRRRWRTRSRTRTAPCQLTHSRQGRAASLRYIFQIFWCCSIGCDVSESSALLGARVPCLASQGDKSIAKRQVCWEYKNQQKWKTKRQLTSRDSCKLGPSMLVCFKFKFLLTLVLIDISYHCQWNIMKTLFKEWKKRNTVIYFKVLWALL